MFWEWLGSWAGKLGTRTDKHFVEKFFLPPHADISWPEQSMSLAHQAPESATQLDPFSGFTCKVSWFLAIDNAGRRWEVRPGVGRRARWIRWHSRRRRYYPIDWKQARAVLACGSVLSGKGFGS